MHRDLLFARQVIRPMVVLGPWQMILGGRHGSASQSIKCRLLIFNVPSQIIIDYDVLTAALEFPNIGSCLWIKIRKGVGALS